MLGVAAPSDQTILITSPAGGEGKTVTVVNLAAALAEIGRRVTVVSADLRRPGLERIFAANDLAGLSQGLTGEASASELVHETAIPNLRFVPSGVQSNEIEPVNLLQSDRMRELLAAWGRDADFILVDSPPVLGVPDALMLARMVDGVLFLIDAEANRWEDVVSARDELERAGGVLLAGVLNRVSVSRRDRRAWKARGVPARPTQTDRTSRSTKKHPRRVVHQEL
jgi:capsular exopolysaccharide synthesis family protein